MNGALQEVLFRPSGQSRDWSLAASVSSIVAALVASACCAGPLVFALLGEA